MSLPSVSFQPPILIYPALSGSIRDQMQKVVRPNYVPVAEGNLRETALPNGNVVVPGSEPVLSDGEFTIEETDLRFPGFGIPYAFTRYYRSGVHYRTPLGAGWSHSMQRRILKANSAASDCSAAYPDVFYLSERLERIKFSPVSANQGPDGTDVRYVPELNLPFLLDYFPDNKDASWVLRDADGIRYVFEGSYGNLVAIRDPANHSIRINWDHSSWQELGGKITSVEDTTGRVIYYNYSKLNFAQNGKNGDGETEDNTQTSFDVLTCLSLSPDCKTPLISFEMDPPTNPSGDAYNALPDFDLVRVLDANGQGPTYKYYPYDPQTAKNFIPDAGLVDFCQSFSGQKQDNCNYYDVCAVVAEAAVRAACHPIGQAFGDPAGSCVAYCIQMCDGPYQDCYFARLGRDGKGERPQGPSDNSSLWCDNVESLSYCSHPENLDTPICKDVIITNGYPTPIPDVCQEEEADCLDKYLWLAAELNSLSLCSLSSYYDCLTFKGAKDKNGLRRYAFGIPQDLHHNLTDVFDGDMRLIVHNVYGEDPFAPDFDKVKVHVQGQGPDNTMTFEYHDLTFEQSEQATPQPYASLVDALDNFNSVSLCHRPCLKEHLENDPVTGNQMRICDEYGTTYDVPSTEAKGHNESQYPAYAVVIHDIGNVVKTEYYDSAWNPLREVNHTAGTTVNYNYQNGSLAGVQEPSGERICFENDTFGKPTRITEIPAPGYPGDQTPKVTLLTYDDNEQLIELVRNPDSSIPSGVHFDRDEYERVTAMGVQVDSVNSEWTCFEYADSARIASSPEGSLPVRAVHPLAPAIPPPDEEQSMSIGKPFLLGQPVPSGVARPAGPTPASVVALRSSSSVTFTQQIHSLLPRDSSMFRTNAINVVSADVVRTNGIVTPPNDIVGTNQFGSVKTNLFGPAMFIRSGCALVKGLATSVELTPIATEGPILHAVIPSRITKPDGSVTKLAEISSAGPGNIMQDAGSQDPIQYYLNYDDFGRINELGRKIPGSGSVLPGSSTRAIYDAAGLQKTNSFQDPNTGDWVDTILGYDKSHHLVSVDTPTCHRDIAVDALGHVTGALEAPNPTDTHNTKPRTTKYTFDIHDRLLEKVFPEGNQETYDYDPADLYLQVMKGDRLISPQISGMEGIAFFANNSGGFSKARLIDGVNVQFVTDGFGRIIDTIIPEGVGSQELSSYGEQKESASTTRFVPPTSVLNTNIVGTNQFGPNATEAIGTKRVESTVTNLIGTNPRLPPPGSSSAQSGSRHFVKGYDPLGRVAWEGIFDNAPDGYKKPTQPVAGMHAMVEYHYDLLNRPTQISRWRFVEGLLVGVDPTVDPKGLLATTWISYDDTTGITTISDPEGNTNVVKLDALGRLKHKTLAAGTSDAEEIDYVYAQGGDLLTVALSPAPTSSGQLVRNFTFNPLGQVTEINEAGVTIMAQTYDSLGRLTNTVETGMGGRSFEYDAYDRLVAVHQATDAATVSTATYEWDGNNRLTQVTDGAGHSTTNVYDGLDRLLEQDNGLGSVKYRYLLGTAHVGLRQAPATTQTNTYDEAGHVVQIDIGDPKTGVMTSRSYAYTAQDELRLATAKDSFGTNSVTFGYDSLGRTLSEFNSTLPLGITHSYSSGTKTTTVIRDRNPAATLTKNYDSRYRTKGLLLNNNPVALFDYHNGSITSITYGNQVQQSFSYDDRARPISVKVTINGNNIARLNDALGIDSVPRARQRTFGALPNVTDLFKSDLAGRVIGENLQVPNLTLLSGDVNNADVDGQWNTAFSWSTYQLDGAANWVNRMGSEAMAPTIDNANRYSAMASDQAVYDPLGNLLQFRNDTYTWSLFGNLTSASRNGRTEAYSYDALGRRIAETEAEMTSYFVWDGDKILAIAPAADIDSTRLRVGSRSDDTLAFVDGLGSGLTYYTHPRSDGSAFATTDPQGKLIEGYEYSAYGETTFVDPQGDNRPQSQIGNRFLYQGQLYDSALGLYYMRAREYVPAWGRFLSPDPIGLEGGFNLYAYVDGEPLTYSDPSGFGKWTAGQALAQLVQAAKDQERMFQPRFFNKDFGVSMYVSPANRTPWVLDRNNFIVGMIQGVGNPGDPQFYIRAVAQETYHVYNKFGEYKGFLDAAHGGATAPLIDPAPLFVGAASSALRAGLGLAGGMLQSAATEEAVVLEESILAAEGGTTLYRAVGPAELADIQANGILRNLGSAEGKYFTTSAEAASSYAKQAVAGFGDPPYTLIQTRVPNSIFEGLAPATVDRGIPAWVIPNNRLPGLTPQVLPTMPIPFHP